MSDQRRSEGEPEALRNGVLAALPANELERIERDLTLVDLPYKQVLIEHNQPIEAVYFPVAGMVSLISLMADGSGIEVASIGREGVVGVPTFLGCETMAGQAVTQIAGSALRMPVPAFREAAAECEVLSARLGRYTQALLTLVSQSSGCNRVHLVEPRCARWLLMVEDRVGRSFPLTHLFLSQMLGVRRATVTEVLGRFQDAGLIEYRRGRITIVDRGGLEGAACECYGIVESEFAWLMEGKRVPSPLDGVVTSAHGRSLAGDGGPDDLV
jgi:CRP-like cAMP-binding protein